jgi:hypothetical protein
METANTSETSAKVYKTRRYRNTEDARIQPVWVCFRSRRISAKDDDVAGPMYVSLLFRSAARSEPYLFPTVQSPVLDRIRDE